MLGVTYIQFKSLFLVQLYNCFVPNKIFISIKTTKSKETNTSVAPTKYIVLFRGNKFFKQNYGNFVLGITYIHSK